MPFKDKAPLMAACILILVAILRIVFEFVEGPAIDAGSVLFVIGTTLFCYSLYSVFNIGLDDEYKRHAQKLIKWLLMIAFVFLLANIPFSLYQPDFLSRYMFDSAHGIIVLFFSVIAATCLFTLGSSIQSIRIDDIPLAKSLKISIYFLAVFQFFYAADRMLLISGLIVAIHIFVCLLIDAIKLNISARVATAVARFIAVFVPLLFVVVYFNNLRHFTESSSDFISDAVWGDDGFTPRKVKPKREEASADALINQLFALKKTGSITPVIHSAWFVDENTAFAIGLRKIYKSVDKGYSWQYLHDIPYNAERISASRDGLRLVIELADRNVVFFSEDAGKRWNTFDLSAQLLASRNHSRDEDFIWNRSSQLRLDPQSGYGYVIFDCEHWYTEDFSKTWQSVNYKKINGEKLCPGEDIDAVQEDRLRVITEWGTIWTRDNTDAGFSKDCQDMSRDGAIGFQGFDKCEKNQPNSIAMDALKLDLISDNVIDAENVDGYIRKNNGVSWIESYGFLALRENAKDWKVLLNTSAGYSQVLLNDNKAISIGNDDIWYSINNGKIWLPLGLASKENHAWNSEQHILYTISEDKLLAITFSGDKPEFKTLKTFTEEYGVNDVRIGLSHDNKVIWLINDYVKLLSIDGGAAWQSFDNDQLMDVDCINGESCVALLAPASVAGFNARHITVLDDSVEIPLTDDDSEEEQTFGKIWHSEDVIVIADSYEEILYRYNSKDADAKRLRIAIDEYSSFYSLKWSRNNTMAYADKVGNIIYLVNLQQDSWQELSFDAWDEVHILCVSDNAQHFLLQGRKGDSRSLIISNDFGATWRASPQPQSITSCEKSPHQLWLYTESELSVYGASQ